jgi:hypothetical protein
LLTDDLGLWFVKPETVVSWHRQGFRLFWRRKSRGKPGRPSVPRDVQILIRRVAIGNPLWGVPRIQAELRMLGHDLAESTVAKYVPKARKPSPQTWKPFCETTPQTSSRLTPSRCRV